MFKEPIVANFKMISRQYPEGCEENDKTPVKIASYRSWF